MKKLLLGGTMLAALAVSAPAMAADMPVKAPIIAPVIFSWTGFYIGGNLGYSWGRGDPDFTETTSGTTVTQVFRTAGQNLVSTTTTAIPPVSAGGSDRGHINGVIGGGQIGYNWQNGWAVYGIESDLDATGQRGNTIICVTAGCPAGGVFGSASYKLPWLATLRGRVGVTVTPRVLLYVTGGLAVAEVDSTFAGGLSGGPVTSITSNPFKVGFAVGGGVEGAFDNNWSAKLEALWVDLGSYDTAFAGVTNTTVTNALNTPSTGFNTLTTTTTTTSGNFHSQVTDFIVRVGVNYRFNAPVVAKY